MLYRRARVLCARARTCMRNCKLIPWRVRVRVCACACACVRARVPQSPAPPTQNCSFMGGDVLMTARAYFGVLVFGAYIIHNTQLMMGGSKRRQLRPDEHIMAALSLCACRMAARDSRHSRSRLTPKHLCPRCRRLEPLPPSPVFALCTCHMHMPHAHAHAHVHAHPAQYERPEPACYPKPVSATPCTIPELSRRCRGWAAGWQTLTSSTSSSTCSKRWRATRGISGNALPPPWAMRSLLHGPCAPPWAMRSSMGHALPPWAMCAPAGAVQLLRKGAPGLGMAWRPCVAPARSLAPAADFVDASPGTYSFKRWPTYFGLV